MKRLVLLGEGQGEEQALPVLVNKLLREKGTEGPLFVDRDVIRTGSSFVTWRHTATQPDFSEWLRFLTVAARRPGTAAVLAVYDGDLPSFPPGSGLPFCPATAAKAMVAAAANAGAGKLFSLSVVFACAEYETWLVASAESLAGRQLMGARLALPRGTAFPPGDPESHGKKWLEENMPSYRPTRDQAALTELLDPSAVRAKGLRSFQRLEHALDQLLAAVITGHHISTPA